MWYHGNAFPLMGGLVTPLVSYGARGFLRRRAALSLQESEQYCFDSSPSFQGLPQTTHAPGPRLRLADSARPCSLVSMGVRLSGLPLPFLRGMGPLYHAGSENTTVGY